MKNVLIVDIDTERENQVMFGKGKDFKFPEGDVEKQEVMMMDIQTLVDALNHLLIYSNKNELRNEISEYIRVGGIPISQEKIDDDKNEIKE